MSTWTGTQYFSFVDQKEAQAKLAAAEIVPVDSFAPLGVFAALVAPITEWQTSPSGTPAAPVAGIAKPGFWVMLKLDRGWKGYDAAIALLKPYAQTLAVPQNVFAGDK